MVARVQSPNFEGSMGTKTIDNVEVQEHEKQICAVGDRGTRQFMTL